MKHINQAKDRWLNLFNNFLRIYLTNSDDQNIKYYLNLICVQRKDIKEEFEKLLTTEQESHKFNNFKKSKIEITNKIFLFKFNSTKDILDRNFKIIYEKTYNLYEQEKTNYTDAEAKELFNNMHEKFELQKNNSGKLLVNVLLSLEESLVESKKNEKFTKKIEELEVASDKIVDKYIPKIYSLDEFNKIWTLVKSFNKKYKDDGLHVIYSKKNLVTIKGTVEKKSWEEWKLFFEYLIPDGLLNENIDDKTFQSLIKESLQILQSNKTEKFYREVLKSYSLNHEEIENVLRSVRDFKPEKSILEKYDFKIDTFDEFEKEKGKLRKPWEMKNWERELFEESNEELINSQYKEPRKINDKYDLIIKKFKKLKNKKEFSLKTEIENFYYNKILTCNGNQKVKAIEKQLEQNNRIEIGTTLEFCYPFNEKEKEIIKEIIIKVKNFVISKLSLQGDLLKSEDCEKANINSNEKTLAIHAQNIIAENNLLIKYSNTENKGNNITSNNGGNNNTTNQSKHNVDAIDTNSSGSNWSESKTSNTSKTINPFPDEETLEKMVIKYLEKKEILKSLPFILEVDVKNFFNIMLNNWNAIKILINNCSYPPISYIFLIQDVIFNKLNDFLNEVSKVEDRKVIQNMKYALSMLVKDICLTLIADRIKNYQFYCNIKFKNKKAYKKLNGHLKSVIEHFLWIIVNLSDIINFVDDGNNYDLINALKMNKFSKRKLSNINECEYKKLKNVIWKILIRSKEIIIKNFENIDALPLENPLSKGKYFTDLPCFLDSLPHCSKTEFSKKEQLKEKTMSEILESTLKPADWATLKIDWNIVFLEPKENNWSDPKIPLNVENENISFEKKLMNENHNSISVKRSNQSLLYCNSRKI